jgi:hypothetical protein
MDKSANVSFTIAEDSEVMIGIFEKVSIEGAIINGNIIMTKLMDKVAMLAIIKVDIIATMYKAQWAIAMAMKVYRKHLRELILLMMGIKGLEWELVKGIKGKVARMGGWNLGFLKFFRAPYWK